MKSLLSDLPTNTETADMEPSGYLLALSLRLAAVKRPVNHAMAAIPAWPAAEKQQRLPSGWPAAPMPYASNPA